MDGPYSAWLYPIEFYQLFQLTHGSINLKMTKYRTCHFIIRINDVNYHIILFVLNGVSEEMAQSVTPLSLGSHCMLGEPLLAL